MTHYIPTDEQKAARDEQVDGWKRILYTGELLTLIAADGDILHIYSAHPSGGYRRIRIETGYGGDRLDVGRLDVGQMRFAPAALAGWLRRDWTDGYREHEEEA